MEVNIKNYYPFGNTHVSEAYREKLARELRAPRFMGLFAIKQGACNDVKVNLIRRFVSVWKVKRNRINLGS